MRDVRSNFSRALESAQHLIRGAMGDLAQRLANVSGHQALVPRRSLPAIAAAARVAACHGRGRASTAAQRRGPVGAMACAARSVAVKLPQQKLHFFFVASHRPRGGRCPFREIKCGPAAADGRSDTAGDLRYRATPERGGKTPHGAGPPRRSFVPDFLRAQETRAVRSHEGSFRYGRYNSNSLGRTAS